MADFKLTAEEIQQNWKTFMNTIDKVFDKTPERRDKLKKLYTDYKEEAMFSPASIRDYYHNAIPGGYIDHVNRVINFSVKYYKLYTELGMKLDDFTKEEMVFCAINHDLGKMGFGGEGQEGYQVEESDWHRKNQGKMYKPNMRNPFARIQDKSLFILQKYGINCTWNEYLTILIHDGLYDEGNSAYYKSYKKESKLRTNLPMLLHQADMAAARWEWERWNKHSQQLNLSRIDVPIGTDEPIKQEKAKPKQENNPFGRFEETFNED